MVNSTMLPGLANLLVLPILGMIVWEDLRDRAIRWWWLPLLAAFLVIGSGPLRTISTTATDVIWNLGFLMLQLSAAGLWMLARGIAPDQVMNSMGAGDLLFFVAVAIGLPFGEFVTYHLSGLMLGLVLHLAWLRLRPKADPTVPLAGYMALLLGLWLLARSHITTTIPLPWPLS